MKVKFTVILLIILISSITVVSAVDLNKLNVPDKFKNTDNATYDNDETGEEISLVTNDSAKLKDYYTNNTDLRQSIKATDKPNIYTFYDGVNDMSGCVELIEIDNTIYVVDIWVSGNADENKLQQMSETLVKFNELNNFTTLDPTIVLN